jgi:hypothetical protein
MLLFGFLLGSWALLFALEILMGMMRGVYLLKMQRPLRIVYRSFGFLRSKVALALLALNAFMVYRTLHRGKSASLSGEE